MFEREPVVGTMSTQVARILGTRIVGGEFKPGEALPVEAELCAAFGVSRTTVREAIKHLAGKRLIEVSPKIGTRVLPFNEWNLLDREVLAWRLQAQFDSQIVEDIFEMRLCIEPRASYLAAQRGTTEDFAQLERRYAELAKASGGEVRLVAQADLEFHLSIINTSRNGLFITIGGAVKAALRVSSEMLHRNASNPGEDLALYDAVRQAITTRQPDDAAAAMTRLLQASRRRLLPLTTPGDAV
ncbi:FadR/GntR family transcriptional regulator [Silvimonas amylolytica]|uniref:GntR family transcriptional regulator n=1 Tax=Silvimonas amylolytica TaxID=449663 RepID=A0ABQ2PMN3_9NEIS|nr:FadR/GntR family transcriptional regulator [Silvimonas amylolytica]GGP26869.1 GntR family transcriptional regulator [Silvimonas amylolytica]